MTDLRDVLLRVAREIQRDRVAPAPVTVEVIGCGAGPARALVGGGFEDDGLGDALAQVLGGGAPGRAPFSPLASARFPVLAGLHRRFLTAAGPARLYRVDDDETLDEFSSDRLAARLADAEARLAALEVSLDDHLADGHSARLDQLEDAFRRHCEEHVAGYGDYAGGEYLGDDPVAFRRAEEAVLGARGETVPLSLEPWAEGKVDCRREGDEVICSVRVCGEDGVGRVLTTGTPVRRHADAAARYARRAGVDPLDVAPIFRPLVGVCAGSYLLTQVAAAASEVLGCVGAGGEVPVVARATSSGDPALAAAMALLQMCQCGDGAACAEAARVRALPGGARFLEDAARELRRAQGGR